MHVWCDVWNASDHHVLSKSQPNNIMQSFQIEVDVELKQTLLKEIFSFSILLSNITSRRCRDATIQRLTSSFFVWCRIFRKQMNACVAYVHCPTETFHWESRHSAESEDYDKIMHGLRHAVTIEWHVKNLFFFLNIFLCTQLPLPIIIPHVW